MRPLRGRALASAVACVALVVSCSRGSPATPRSAADGTPRPGGILRVGVVGPAGEPAAERLRTLDPAQARSRSELLAARQLFEALTTYDPVTLEVRPALAGWQASPDQRHWDFRLRPGARFSSGRPVTPEDVRYSLERVARKGSGSPYAGRLEAVTGFKAFSVDGTAPALAGLSTPVPDVLRIDLDSPLAVLPALLGSPGLGVVAREAVEAPVPPFADRPVGSGPFAVSDRSETSLRLTRAPGSAALVDRVDLVFEPNADTAYRELTAERLDWSPVPANQAPEAMRRSSSGDVTRPDQAELFYGFNLKSPKLADPRFREAIVRAVDRPRVVADVYGAAARPLSGVVPEGTPGQAPDVCGDRCRPDPARARALVAEAFGGGRPPEVFVDYDSDPIQERVASALARSLVEVGIPATPRPHPPAEYLAFLLGGQQELFRLGWVGAYPSPDAYLAPLFASAAPDNLTGFSSPEVDNLVGEARAQADPARRAEIYARTQRAVMAQVPVMPVAQLVTLSATGTRVRGLTVSGEGLFDASRVWFAPGR